MNYKTRHCRVTCIVSAMIILVVKERKKEKKKKKGNVASASKWPNRSMKHNRA